MWEIKTGYTRPNKKKKRPYIVHQHMTPASNLQLEQQSTRYPSSKTIRTLHELRQ
jgi:hypothetical protein